MTSDKELIYGIAKNGKSAEKLSGFTLNGNVTLRFDALQSLFSVKFNEQPKIVDSASNTITFTLGGKEINLSAKVEKVLKDLQSVTFASH